MIAGELLLEAQQALFIARLHQLVDQGGGGDEADGEASLTGRQAETEGDMGLAGAGGPEGNDVLLALDVVAARQFHDQGLVERGNGLEVEGIEALHRREAGLLDAPFDQAALTVDQFQLREAQQIAHVIDALGGALAGDLVVFPEEGRQPQLLQMMIQQNLGRIAHDPPPDNRLR